MVEASLVPSIALLKTIRLFQSFDELQLAKLLKVGETVRFEPHTNIVIEGEQSWGLYFILEGVVGIYKNNRLTGDNYDIGQLRNGNFFGELSLVDHSARSATIRTLTPCQFFYLSKDKFMGFLTSTPGLQLKFYEACVALLASRLRDLDESYVVSQYQLWKTALKKEIA